MLSIEGCIIGKGYLDLVIQKDLYRFVGVVVIQIVLFYLTRFMIKRTKKDSTYSLKWNEWFVLLIIPVISIFTMSFVSLIIINTIVTDATYFFNSINIGNTDDKFFSICTICEYAEGSCKTA